MLLSCDLALKSYLFESSKSTGQWQCKASLNETIMKYNQYVLSGLVVLVTILSIIFAIFLKKQKLWCYEDPVPPKKQNNRGTYRAISTLRILILIQRVNQFSYFIIKNRLKCSFV